MTEYGRNIDVHYNSTNIVSCNSLCLSLSLSMSISRTTLSLTTRQEKPLLLFVLQSPSSSFSPSTLDQSKSNHPKKQNPPRNTEPPTTSKRRRNGKKKPPATGKKYSWNKLFKSFLYIFNTISSLNQNPIISFIVNVEPHVVLCTEVP